MQVGPVGEIGPPDGDAGGPSRAARAGAAVRVYAIAAIVVVLDQVSKLAAVRFLQPLDSVPVLGPYASLTWATNTGGAFGLMSAATPVLAAVGVVVIGALIALAPRVADSRLLTAATACLIGGAVGNLIDRLRLGYVIDFIDLHVWPIFNIADIAITVGAGLVIIAAAGGLLTHTADED